MNINKNVLLSIIFLLWSLYIFSQNSSIGRAEQALILDVRVEGNKKIERDLILSTSAIRIGDNFSSEIITHAIKALYQLYVFDDVNIYYEFKEQKAYLTIVVHELPIVTKYTYDGNKHLSKNKLEESGVLKLGTYWSPIVQSENTARILREYQSKGYHRAELEYRFKEVNEGIEVRVIINEGKKIVVRNINFYLNDSLVQNQKPVLDQEQSTNMSQIGTKKLYKAMKKTKRRGWFRSGKFEEEAYAEDLVKIAELYHNSGFIDARVVRTSKTIDNERFLTLEIFLEEGSKFFFGDISIQGNHFFDTKTLMQNFTLRPNDVYNLEKFNKQLSSLASMYYEEGFIYLRTDPNTTRSNNNINIEILLTENTQAKIHKIHFTGNTKTKEKILRRQLVIAPGDFFKQSRVIRSQQNIYNLGFFDPDMNLDYNPINNNGDVDLYINVIDKPSGTVNGGVGYNSRDQWLGQFSISQNNLLGNYWQTSLAWEFSKSNNNIEFSFTNPYTFDTDILSGFSVYYTDRNWGSYNVQTEGGSVRVGYPIKAIDFTRIVTGYSLYSRAYRLSSGYDYNSVSSSLQRVVDEGRQYTSSVYTALTRDSRDNIFFPTSGSRMYLYQELAGGVFGGDNDYYKLIAETSWFTPAFLTTVLRTKWRYGYITSYGQSSDVPPDEKFALGGTGVDGVRGYTDNTIGPRDSGYVGGLRGLIFSSELGIPIASDQLVGIVFFDAGNSFNSVQEFNFKDFEQGSGLGIRIRTPFGLMGFDMAYRFRTFEGKKPGWEPHFQFGTTF